MATNYSKESLFYTINALYVPGNIIDKDYRMWFKLNCKTRISDNLGRRIRYFTA